MTRKKWRLRERKTLLRFRSPDGCCEVVKTCCHLKSSVRLLNRSEVVFVSEITRSSSKDFLIKRYQKKLFFGPRWPARWGKVVLQPDMTSETKRLEESMLWPATMSEIRRSCDQRQNKLREYPVWRRRNPWGHCLSDNRTANTVHIWIECLQ